MHSHELSAQLLTLPIRYSIRCCGPEGWFISETYALGSLFRSPFHPVIAFCPQRLTKHYSLVLSKDAVVYQSATNGLCCEIKESEQILSLANVKDVNVQVGCWESCFGLKKLTIVSRSPRKEGLSDDDIISAALADPDAAREAISLALTQFRDQKAPGDQSMERGGGDHSNR
jgi:hypothetical protein